MLQRVASVFVPLASLACLASLAPASAQSATFQIIAAPGWSAVDVSDDGDDVVGVAGSNGFRWDAVGGFQPLNGGEAWAITVDGSRVAGAMPVAAKRECALWTSGTGWVSQGNYGGSPGCDASVSNFEDISADGQWAAGMSWQGCKTFAMRWNASTGLELLPKQVATASARAICISNDGQTCAGWETVGGPRGAAVWLPDGTEIFPLVSPTNTLGIGEFQAMNGDGSVMCGVTQTFPFLWKQAGGVQLLPKIVGLAGTYIALDVNADGTVVVGQCLQGPVSNAWIWTAANGTQTMLSWLQAKGVPGLSSTQFGAATGISDDGLSICGWGNSGAWFARVDSPWTDLGQGLAGAAGVPTLAGSGTLQPGSSVLVALGGALPTSPATLVVGFAQLNAPFKGGVLVPSVDLLLAGFVTSGSGTIPLAATWPVGLPSSFDTFFQWWIADAAGPKGFAASNALKSTTP